MVMETDQEVIIGLSSFKGKRTKRQRPASPIGLPATYSAGESGTATGDSRITSSSFDSNNNNNFSGGEEEEEDMANCLILLARGSPEINREITPVAVRPRPAAGDGGDYRCKTCNRSFPSFQALGGHRAGHKKPINKLGKEENTIKLPEKLFEEFDHQNRKFIENPMSTNLSLQISNNINYISKGNSSKIHECSICGAEFSSGQALGGHMRRHRTVFSSSTAAAITDLPSTIAPSGANSGQNNPPEFRESKKSRSSLQLDLNLPAESEEDTLVRESELRFPSKEQVLAFSANSLVDCHY